MKDCENIIRGRGGVGNIEIPLQIALAQIMGGGLGL